MAGEKMETSLTFLFFVIGLFIIVKGGDLFIDGAVWIAYKTGIPSAIVGATIVSIATTLPELFVSTVASNEGYSEMALGNSIGSTICNISFVLGICTIIKPIKIKNKFFGIKGFMMIAYLIIFFFLSLDGVVTHKEGLILIFLFLIFIGLNILELREDDINKNKKVKRTFSKKENIISLIKFIIGAWFIVIGAHILVDTGVKIAYILRIPKQVVSLTLLAVGTSLPELVTSISAIIKNEENISVGNILGANILNLTIVLGFSSLVSDNGLIVQRQTILLDLPMSLLVMLLFVFKGIFKNELDRKLGGVLLAIYLIYLLILF